MFGAVHGDNKVCTVPNKMCTVAEVPRASPARSRFV
jgi:hypothetical protein